MNLKLNRYYTILLVSKSTSLNDRNQNNLTLQSQINFNTITSNWKQNVLQI